jgi:hypothetical protein
MHNGDKDKDFNVGPDLVVGLGSFTKSLPHDDFGEVSRADFAAFKASLGGWPAMDSIPYGGASKHDTAKLTNPAAGLAKDRLIDPPSTYTMPPAPSVLSNATAAEMVELYWMALLRDVPLDELATHPDAAAAADDINAALSQPGAIGMEGLHLDIDLESDGKGGLKPFTPESLFRLGLPGGAQGPMVSQFFVRPVPFGTQMIDVRQRPYRAWKDYLTDFPSWLAAQRTGKDDKGADYSGANEYGAEAFEYESRYISTMRDLARFVNKDALHQAYFKAALLLLSGKARWTFGNPYEPDMAPRERRDAGFGVLGGPHILALVSEVATRALKAVWFQKWQTHLRLRPEAYGGLAQVQMLGNATGATRPYGLPDWFFKTEAAKRVKAKNGTYLLPMAYSPGSPVHPAYGAGHATVAGACVTVLKAFFSMDKAEPNGSVRPLKLTELTERAQPYGKGDAMTAYATGMYGNVGTRYPLDAATADSLTVEGELNKLAHNVAMGRSMGGVHWRTDNARSLAFGEALAAHILMDIANDVAEDVTFTFRTFARKADGTPKTCTISKDSMSVTGVSGLSAL